MNVYKKKYWSETQNKVYILQLTPISFSAGTLPALARDRREILKFYFIR